MHLGLFCSLFFNFVISGCGTRKKAKCEFRVKGSGNNQQGLGKLKNVNKAESGVRVCVSVSAQFRKSNLAFLNVNQALISSIIDSISIYTSMKDHA